MDEEKIVKKVVGEKKKVGRKKDGMGVFIPVLVLGLIIAVFFVGRLSSQVEYLKDGRVAGRATDRVADSGADDGAGGVEVGPSMIGIENLKVMADELGIDRQEFDSCLSEGKYEQKIKDDIGEGSKWEVSGTPSFFINNVLIMGAQPEEMFTRVIDFELSGGDWNNPSEAVADLVDEDPTNNEVSLIDGVVKGKGRVKGNSESLVRIIEFSDFECPFCARALPIIKSIMEKYGDKVSLEYRHFPLGFHANAQKAAEAFECAGDQGKAWEMHDLIFEAQE